MYKYEISTYGNEIKQTKQHKRKKERTVQHKPSDRPYVKPLTSSFKIPTFYVNNIGNMKKSSHYLLDVFLTVPSVSADM